MPSINVVWSLEADWSNHDYNMILDKASLQQSLNWPVNPLLWQSVQTRHGISFFLVQMSDLRNLPLKKRLYRPELVNTSSQSSFSNDSSATVASEENCSNQQNTPQHGSFIKNVVTILFLNSVNLVFFLLFLPIYQVVIWIKQILHSVASNVPKNFWPKTVCEFMSDATWTNPWVGTCVMFVVKLFHKNPDKLVTWGFIPRKNHSNVMFVANIFLTFPPSPNTSVFIRVKNRIHVRCVREISVKVVTYIVISGWFTWKMCESRTNLNHKYVTIKCVLLLDEWTIWKPNWKRCESSGT